MRAAVALLGVALAGISAGAPAGEIVEPFSIAEGSTLTFVAVQAGAPFTGRFEDFDARILFDPAALEHSSFAVRVATASVATDYADRDDILRGEEFFRVREFPYAVFEARQFTKTGEGEFVASGRLRIRDTTLAIELPFRFFRDPERQARYIMSGSVLINRMDFGIGSGEWADPRWVGREVEVRFRLLLREPAD